MGKDVYAWLYAIYAAKLSKKIDICKNMTVFSLFLLHIPKKNCNFAANFIEYTIQPCCDYFL